MSYVCCNVASGSRINMLGFNMVDIDKRLVHAFVLLGRQYLVNEHIVKLRKPRVLSLFEKAVNNKKTSINDVIRVYDLAFSIVDNIVRYQKIASILPRFSQKSEEFKTFDSKCKVDIDGKQYRVEEHFFALAMEFKPVTGQTQQGTPADQ